MQLRPTLESDLSFIVQAEADIENRPFIIPWESGRHALALHDPAIRHFVLWDENGNRVGFAILAGWGLSHAVELRRIVVTVKGQGYGRLILRHVKQLVFDDRRFKRLWLDVREDNFRAITLYKSEGFFEESLLENALQTPDGARNLLIMAISLTSRSL